MKTIKMISLLLVMTAVSISCTGQAEKNEETSMKKTDGVQVYYFHNERRCATCKAIESESKKALEELYGDKVAFMVFNLEEEEGEEKATEIGVSGQTLLIVKGETKINITNEAFMNARNSPDKLKQTIREKIDPLM